MRTHSIAALVLAAILALSACSDDDPDPGDPMSTWTPSGTPEAPSSSATPSADPTEPPLPDAAREATEAGARAFITYYWDLINYAQVTGDVKALRKVSAPQCTGCSAGIKGIRDVYGSGGHVEGGEYTVTISTVAELDGPSNAYLIESLLTATNAAQIVVKGDGTKHRSKASTAQLAVAASWMSSSWRMEVMDPR